jgi:hypothetical protein
MYITEVLTKTTTGKIAHRCILLRESYREHSKVKTRTLANLTTALPPTSPLCGGFSKRNKPCSALQSARGCWSGSSAMP